MRDVKSKVFIDPAVPVVADQTDTVVVAFWHDHGQSRTEQHPVIAWSLSNPPTPITAEQIDTIYCLKLSTGLWVFPGDCAFEDEVSAVEYGKSRAKAVRERLALR